MSKSEIFYNMGTNSLMKKEYTEALSKLLDANKLDPDNSKILNNLGMAYYFKKDVESAKNYLTKSLKIDSDNADARNNLASIYLEEGKITLAEEQYLKITTILTYTNRFRTFYNLGILNQKLGNEEKAKSYFQQSIEENINYCPGHLQLGHLAYRDQKYEKALEHYKDASMGICFHNPVSQYGSAKTLLKLERYDKAIAKFEEIANRFTDSKYSKMALMQINMINKQFKTTKDDPTDKFEKIKKNKNSQLLNKNSTYTPIF